MTNQFGGIPVNQTPEKKQSGAPAQNMFGGIPVISPVSQQKAQPQPLSEKALGVLEQFAYGVNKSVAETIDFFGIDIINGLLAKAGINEQIPTATATLDKYAGESNLEEGLLKDVSGRAGEVSTLALGMGGLARSAAASLPKMAQGESVAAGITRELGNTTKLQDVSLGAMSGVGAEVGQEYGGDVGETVGGLAFPLVGGAAANVVKATGQAIPKELDAAFRQGTVMTSDVFPPQTSLGKQWQREVERTPLVGTGGARKVQQDERAKAAEELANSYGVRVETSFDTDIVNSAQGVFKASRERATTLKGEAVNELTKGGSVDTSKTYKLIDDLIKEESKAGALKNQGTIDYLKKVQAEIVSGDFPKIIQVRTRVFNEIKDAGGVNSPIRTSDDAILEKVRGSLSNDLNTFAEGYSKTAADKSGRLAANKWKASNRIYVDGFNKAKDQKLKQVLANGEATPELVVSVIRSGKASDLKRLHDALDLEGRASVRSQILKDAMEKAGAYKTPTSGASESYINPTILLNNLDAPKTRTAVNVFFTGKEKKELDGLKRYLALTRRAQESAASPDTGAQMGTFLQKPITNTVKMPFALGTNLYESATVRNLLIKLSNAKDTQAQITYYNLLSPLLSEEISKDPYEQYRESQGGYMENK
jgi:hypothetical protein